MSIETSAVQLDQLERRLEDALRLVREAKRDELTATRWLTTAAELGDLLADVRHASAAVRQSLLGGARTAVLAYLRQQVGQTVPAPALEGVSGIREWARRIRELRAIGWDIVCMGAGAEAPYRLVVDRLDESVANSDRLVSEIKAVKPKDRLIEYLLNVAPWPVPASRLQQVAGSPTWRDDLETLRREGWLIQTHEQDEAVAPGFYRLARLED